MKNSTLIVGIVAIIAILIAAGALSLNFFGTTNIPQRDDDDNNRNGGGDGLLPANVEVESYSHEESVQAIGGFVSEVSFTLTNTGGSDAENVDIHVIAYDGEGNVQYDETTSVTSSLRPEESTTHMVTISYQVLTDDRLDLDINVQWEGGQNSYEESYQVEVLEE